MYFFTNGGSAHPAVVVEKVVQEGTGIGVKHTGYFAGAEEPFAKWFSGFQARRRDSRSDEVTSLGCRDDGGRPTWRGRGDVGHRPT
jgi:hypothetical protein